MVRCNAAADGKVSFDLVMVNRSLTVINTHVSANISGPTGLFSMIGLQTIIGEIDSFEVAIVPLWRVPLRLESAQSPSLSTRPSPWVLYREGSQ